MACCLMGSVVLIGLNVHIREARKPSGKRRASNVLTKRETERWRGDGVSFFATPGFPSFCGKCWRKYPVALFLLWRRNYWKYLQIKNIQLDLCFSQWNCTLVSRSINQHFFKCKKRAFCPSARLNMSIARKSTRTNKIYDHTKCNHFP